MAANARPSRVFKPVKIVPGTSLLIAPTSPAGISVGTSSGLIKLGTGTLTFGGTNSYLGSLTLAAGTLQLGGANAVINSGATISLPGWQASSGGLVKSGAGMLTLGYSNPGANNSYTGSINVNGGTLVIGSGSTVDFGGSAGATIVFGGLTGVSIGNWTGAGSSSNAILTTDITAPAVTSSTSVLTFNPPAISTATLGNLSPPLRLKTIRAGRSNPADFPVSANSSPLLTAAGSLTLANRVPAGGFTLGLAGSGVLAISSAGTQAILSPSGFNIPAILRPSNLSQTPLTNLELTITTGDLTNGTGSLRATLANNGTLLYSAITLTRGRLSYAGQALLLGNHAVTVKMSGQTFAGNVSGADSALLTLAAPGSGSALAVSGSNLAASGFSMSANLRSFYATEESTASGDAGRFAGELMPAPLSADDSKLVQTAAAFSTEPVPEPSVAMLALFGAASLLARRRRG